MGEKRRLSDGEREQRRTQDRERLKAAAERLLTSEDRHANHRSARCRAWHWVASRAASRPASRSSTNWRPRCLGATGRPSTRVLRELVRAGLIDRSSPTGIEQREPLRFTEPAQGSLLG